MKRNTLTTAVLAGLTGVAGMVGVSNAVNLNPDGLGQVLLYPYYSARGGNDTLISIVNTTDNAKSVKVRFLEGLNSREVLDFNLYMSPFDVWVAAITGNDEGGGTLIIPDTSCTVPYFYGQGIAAGETVGSVDFSTFGFSIPESDSSAGTVDGGPTEPERTASGYIEVIEMGTLVDDNGVDVGRGSATAATHVNGVPADCAQLVEAWTQYPAGTGDDFDSYWLNNDGDDNDDDGQTVDHEPPSGGLFGGASILSVDEGTMFSYNATAIDAFATAILHRQPGDINPDLSFGDLTSNVFINGIVDTQTWEDGVEAVSANLMFDTLMNEYVTGGQSNGRSEWVITFPTKRFYVDQPFAIGVVPVAPFTVAWDEDEDRPGTACEPVDFTFWDREETQPGQGPGPDPVEPIPSPPPPPDQPPPPNVFELCYESNVLRFAGSDDIPDNSEILKEPRFTTFPIADAGFTSGWVRFEFNSADPLVPEHATRPSDAGIQYLGLPAIGFWVNTFTNGQLAGGTVLANYGGSFQHRGSRRLQVFEEPID